MRKKPFKLWTVLLLVAILASFGALSACSDVNGTGVGSFSITAPADNATNVSTTPTITWSAAANAEWYEILLSANSDMSSPVSGNAFVVDAPSTTLTLTSSLGYNTKYYVSIKAASASSSKSATSSFTTREETVVVIDTSPITVVDFSSYANSAALGEAFINNEDAGEMGIELSDLGESKKGMKLTPGTESWYQVQYTPSVLNWSNRKGITFWFDSSDCTRFYMNLYMTGGMIGYGLEIKPTKNHAAALTVPFELFESVGTEGSFNLADISRIDIGVEGGYVTIGNITVSAEVTQDNRHLWDEAIPDPNAPLVVADFSKYTDTNGLKADFVSRADAGGTLDIELNTVDTVNYAKLTPANGKTWYQARYTVPTASRNWTNRDYIVFELISEYEDGTEFYLNIKDSSGAYDALSMKLNIAHSGTIYMPISSFKQGEWSYSPLIKSAIITLEFGINPASSATSAIKLGSISVVKDTDGTLSGNLEDWQGETEEPTPPTGDAVYETFISYDYSIYNDNTELNSDFTVKTDGGAGAIALKLTDIEGDAGIKFTPDSGANGWGYFRVTKNFNPKLDWSGKDGLAFRFDTNYTGDAKITILFKDAYTNAKSLTLDLSKAVDGVLYFSYSDFEQPDWAWDGFAFAEIAFMEIGLDGNDDYSGTYFTLGSFYTFTVTYEETTEITGTMLNDFESYEDDTALRADWKMEDKGYDPSHASVTLTTDNGKKNGGEQGMQFYYKSDMGFYSFKADLDVPTGTEGNALALWMKGNGRGEFFLSIFDKDGNEYKLQWGAISTDAQVYEIEFSDFSKEGHSVELTAENISSIKFGFQFWNSDNYSQEYVFVDDICIVNK